jgi:hypothetical protein
VSQFREENGRCYATGLLGAGRTRKVGADLRGSDLIHASPQLNRERERDSREREIIERQRQEEMAHRERERGRCYATGLLGAGRTRKVGADLRGSDLILPAQEEARRITAAILFPELVKPCNTLLPSSTASGSGTPGYAEGWCGPPWV